jgi:hypothetical protein
VTDAFDAVMPAAQVEVSNLATRLVPTVLRDETLLHSGDRVGSENAGGSDHVSAKLRCARGVEEDGWQEE